MYAHFHTARKRSYLLCKRLKFTLTINCTTNNIKCVRTHENGQINDFTRHTAIIIHNFICRIKKFTKKIYKKLCIKFSGRQRSSSWPNRGCGPSVHKVTQYRYGTDVSHLYRVCISVSGPYFFARWSQLLQFWRLSGFI